MSNKITLVPVAMLNSWLESIATKTKNKRVDWRAVPTALSMGFDVHANYYDVQDGNERTPTREAIWFEYKGYSVKNHLDKDLNWSVQVRTFNKNHKDLVIGGNKMSNYRDVVRFTSFELAFDYVKLMADMEDGNTFFPYYPKYSSLTSGKILG